jgi:copper transport protein
MRRRILSLLFACVLVLLLAQTASAHADLVRSEPAAGALLNVAPKELRLEFSEDLDQSFSRVQLFNSKNQIINAGPGQIDAAAPTVLRLALGELPKDSYTAIWRSRSAVDGHVSQGSVPFGVGVAVTTTSLIPALGAPDPATESPPPLDAAARWLDLLVVTIALGGLPFGLLVWRPAFRAWATTADAGAHQAADDAMTRLIRRLILIGGGLFLLTNALFLLSQAATAADVSLIQAFGAPALQLLGSRTGQLILARVLLTLVILALAWRLPSAAGGAAWPWWVAITLAGAVTLTFSLSAHGAAEAQGAALAIALDWLHVAAMIAWLGGLIPLVFALRVARRNPEQALPLALLIPRFSRVAVACVATLTLTGIYSYYLHINQLDLLAATTYGRALLIKLGLFGLLFLIGVVNVLILSPRLRSSGNQLARRFGGNVRIELVTGALLLLAVGAMTSVAPSKTAWEQHERQGLAQVATLGDVQLTLRVAPAQIGDNEWAVDVTDRRPGAQNAPAKVLLRFDMEGMTAGKLQSETQTADKARYITRGSFTSMGGRWNVEVVLRRAGFDDVTHTFQLDIVNSVAQAQ